MAALGVIEHFDVFKHCRLSLLVCVKIRCCPSIACMNTTSDQRERSRYTPDAQYTVCIRREPWSSPPVTVPTPNAHTMVNAASALIWSVVGPTAAFLGCCVPDVRVHFRFVRVRRTAGYAQRSRITP